MQKIKIVKNRDYSDLKKIISEIEKYTGVNVSKDTRSQEDNRVDYRKLFMLIAWNTTNHSQEDIAYFIGKDRSTISHFLNNTKESFIFNNEKLMLIYDMIVNNKSSEDLLMNYRRKIKDNLKVMLGIVDKMSATNKTIELKELIKKTREI